MKLELITAPSIEPVTLLEAKDHLRLGSGSMADDLSALESIAPGSHNVVAAYGLEGAGVDVLNYTALVLLEAGTCGAGGTIDVKLQESDDDVAYTDVSSGAFAQVTEANDEQIYELAYSGTKQYLRAVATVGVAACAFGVTVVRSAPTVADDTLITRLITAARRTCERYQGHVYISQTWDLYLDAWPTTPFKFPLAPLQSVTHIKYYDTDETEYTFSADSYHVDAMGWPGRVGLAYGEVWPTTTLRTLNGVVIRFVAGYGDTVDDVPEDFREAILMLVGHFYENRETTLVRPPDVIPFGVQALLGFEEAVHI